MNRKYVTLALAAALALSASLAAAQEEPRYGGTLRLANRGEPNSFDCASATSITQLQWLAPHYATLLSHDQANYPKVIPYAAKSWKVSDDLKTYTVKLNEGMTFHDGSTLDATDVKATFDRLANPPEGVVSARKSAFADLESIEVVDPLTVVFHLSVPSASFLEVLASPWNCLYSAELLKSNPDYPSKVVMGSGPFVFKEYKPGESWSGTRFKNFVIKGKPYLDGFIGYVTGGPAVFNALASGQVDAHLRQVTVADRKRLKAALGDKIKFQTSPITSVTFMDINTTRPPFDDIRVRQALTLAIDRDVGTKVMGDAAGQRWSNIIFREGHALAPGPEEKKKFLGYSGDMKAQRAEARRLLAEAGQSNLKFVLLNRNIPVPYDMLAVYLIDQWRQIGVTVTQDPRDTAGWATGLKDKNYDVAVDYYGPSSDDPTEVLLKYVPGSSINHTGIKDDELVRLYKEQDQTRDPAKRAELVKAFVDRAVKLAYFIPAFNIERSVAMTNKVHGWTISANYYGGLDLMDVWMSK